VHTGRRLLSFSIGSIPSAINDPCFPATVTSLSAAQNSRLYFLYITLRLHFAEGSYIRRKRLGQGQREVMPLQMVRGVPDCS